MTRTRNGLYFWQLLVAFLLTTGPVWAQSAQDGLASTNGYWKLRTDYQNKITDIQFFSAHNQVLYQEKLVGRHLKLTKRTMRLFDAISDGLANNRLLETQVRGYPLPASQLVSFKPVAATQPEGDEAERSAHLPDRKAIAKVVVTSMVDNAGKLIVFLANPDRKPAYISLMDESQQIDYYVERSVLADYGRYFDIAQLSAGSYCLRIRHPDQTFLYKLTIAKSGRPYRLQRVD